jgi:translocator protein
MKMNGQTVIEFIVSMVCCLGVGFIGGMITAPKIRNWYYRLKKPVFTPPNSAFMPVWTVLYILMGVAVFVVWHTGFSRGGVILAFTVFWIQLFFNLLWSIVFFGLKSLSGGLVVIALMWIAILASIVTFFRVSALAGWLLIPYIIWVTIAANLNFQVWKLNK